MHRFVCDCLIFSNCTVSLCDAYARLQSSMVIMVAVFSIYGIDFAINAGTVQ